MADIVTVINLDGNAIQVNLDNMAFEYDYTGDDLTGQSFVYQGTTYLKTYTYSGPNLTASSRWIAQV